jgi:predicted dehydrogenase
MSKQLDVGVIGCGSIAQHLHIPGYLKTPGCRVVAACDPGAKQRKAVAALVEGVRLYRSHEEMLKAEKLDVVSVCTPNYLHAKQAIAALKSGAHVLLEKPAALSMAEISRIDRARKASGKMVVVGFSHRFMNGPRKARALLQKGEIGKPFMIRVRFAHTGPFPGWAQSRWFYDPEQAGGGAMLDMGIHAIDLCNWLIGPVEDVCAQVGTLRKRIDVDDNAVMALRFTGGKCLGYIEVGWTSPAGFTGIEILGDKGCIVVDYSKGLQLTTGRITPDHAAGSALRSRVVDKNPSRGGWAIEVGEVVRAIRRGDDLGMGIDAGGESLAVALAAYKSARTGRRVKV